MTPAPNPAGPPLVVGLGSPDRGDDAVGPAVARCVAALRLPAVQVVEREDPTSLIELWGGRDLAVLIDAVQSGGDPGALMIIEAGVGSPPLQAEAWARTGRGGTHAFGLAAAVGLSRALNRLPRRLVLIGIEAGGMAHGDPLSAPVNATVGRAVEAVIGVLDDAGALPGGRRRRLRRDGDGHSPQAFQEVGS